jgi:hypothetical protein
MEEELEKLKQQRKENLDYHNKALEDDDKVMMLHYGSQIYTLNKMIDLIELIINK